MLSCGDNDLFGPDHVYTGINLLDAPMLEYIDGAVTGYGEGFDYISLGIVMDGQTVLVRCYGEDRRSKSDEYASVSKPVTAVITLQLWEQGLIRSLDDPIGYYCSKYRDVLPDAYPDVPVTFRHLLSHRSGIPHHERIWSDGKLDLRFEPGSRMLYSTRGYGVLGDVISMIGGRSFGKMVRDYIGTPLGASSIRCPLPFFEAPGGLIQSNISDMALFATGLLNGSYLSDTVLYRHAWVPAGSDESGEMGLGWYIAHPGMENMAVYHAGSNGRPRAFLVLKPQKRSAVVLLGKCTDAGHPQQLPELARRIMEEMDAWDLR